MKRHIILTILCFILFKVTSRAQSSDALNTLLLNQYKKIEVSSNAYRQLILSMIDEDIEEMDESPVKDDFIAYKNELLLLDFTDATVTKDLSVLTKDDLKGLVVNHDKFSQKTIIKPNSNFTISPYLVITADQSMYLRLKIYYSGSGWIFMDHATFLINDIPYHYYFKSQPERETRHSRIAPVEEVLDDLVDTDLLEILHLIAESKKPFEVKLSGDKYTIEKINQRNINRVKNIIDVYEKLK